MTQVTGLIAGLYVGSILAANWAVQAFGIVPVGFGLMAPAGVYAVGATLILRDLLQERVGTRWVLAAILVGAGLSWWVSVSLAIASAAAFAVSELADFAVYTPLRARGQTIAVLTSNVVGALVDSAVFLILAFGSLEFLTGQLVGKLTMTAAVLPLIAWRHALLSRHP